MLFKPESLTDEKISGGSSPYGPLFAYDQTAAARELYDGTGSLYLSIQPDAHDHFKAHPEFHELLKKFTAYNKQNNGGDIPRLWSFILNVKQILEEKIKGDFAELGVWRGNTAAILAMLANKTGREVFLFDTYEGFDPRDTKKSVDKSSKFTPSGTEYTAEDTSLEVVKSVVGPTYRHCRYIKGYFPKSITPEAEKRKYAVVSLDCDLYEPMKAGLEFFYPRMTKGGIFFLHDYSSMFWPGVKKAIDEFLKKSGEHLVLMPDKSGSAFMRKTQ
jgi:hypothetical protein